MGCTLASIFIISWTVSSAYSSPLLNHMSNSLFRHLASFGAFISILAMAIDPFSQQVIQVDIWPPIFTKLTDLLKYHGCSLVSDSRVALLPRANNYTADGVPAQSGGADLSEQIATAMTLGTLDAAVNATAPIPFTCPSGNCTFPAAENDDAFQVLGMYDSCKEINELIRFNSSISGFYLENWAPDQVPDYKDWWDEPAYVGWVFPNSSNSLPYSMFWSRKTLAFSPELDDLITFDYLMLNVDNKTCNLTQSEKCPKHLWAVRCSLYPCV